MANILITGINGFIGSNLARRMCQDGHDVFGTVRENTGQENQIACDICDVQQVRGVIRKINPDVVVHTAALSSVTDGQTLEYYETNVLGTENLIKAVEENNKRTRFIYISTAGVYGNQLTPILSEQLTPLPVSHYGISKYAGERLVLSDFSLNHDVTVVRPFNIVGPGQKIGFIFPKIVRHFRDREPVIRLGNLDPVRDYLDIGSCTSYLSRLIFVPDSYGEIVNLCSGQGTSIRQLIDELNDITGYKIEIIVAPEFVRKNEVWSLLGDPKKLKKLSQLDIEILPIRDVLEQMLHN